MDFTTWDALRGSLRSGQFPRQTTEDAVTEALRLHRVVASNPLTKRYEQHVRQGNAHNTEPWHALGERNYATLTFLYAAMRSAGIIEEDITFDALMENLLGEKESPALTGVSVAHACQEAQVYLWTNDCYRTALATPVPPHVVSRTALPYPLMFWSLETAYAGAGGDQDWFLLMDAEGGVIMWTALSTIVPGQTPKIVITHGGIRYGRPWPDPEVSDDQNKSAGQVLGLLAFLNSPYIEATPQRMERHVRKDILRSKDTAHHHSSEQCASVVKLRRASTTHEAPSEGKEFTRRHKWWVAGHNRAQWYPSEQAHHVIYIAPHLRGPADAPLLEKTYAVVR